jgi:hypothetical protein
MLCLRLSNRLFLQVHQKIVVILIILTGRLGISHVERASEQVGIRKICNVPDHSRQLSSISTVEVGIGKVVMGRVLIKGIVVIVGVSWIAIQ